LRVAYVGLLAAILVALIHFLGPALLEHLRESAPVRITDVAGVRIAGLAATQKGRMIGVDVLLQNDSDRPQALSKFVVRWTQEHRPPPISLFLKLELPVKVYLLEPTVRVISPNEISITGAVKSGDGLSYTIDGNCAIHEQDYWSCSFSFPVRAQVPPHKPGSLTLLMPQVIPISGVRTQRETSLLDQYILGNPPKQLQFLKLLKTLGQTDLTFTVDYSDGRTASKVRRMAFTGE
jgi:hypothetical protein